MGRLDGKVAIITGAARGQGAMHAELCAREGAAVVLADVLDEDGEMVAAKIAKAGGKAIFLHLDITDEANWATVVKKTVESFGKLNVLVNNAAILMRKPIEETTAEEWDKTLAVNAKGAFLGIRASLPEMIRVGGGSIVNISSVAGIRASFVADSAYASSKGALGALSRTIAVQYAAKNIRCNCIYPAHIETAMLHKAHPTQESFEKLAHHVPMGHVGKLEDVAWAVVYFASDESAFTTGADLVIDGGMAARY